MVARWTVMPHTFVSETYIKGVSPPRPGRGRASGAGSDLLRPESDNGTGRQNGRPAPGRVAPGRAARGQAAPGRTGCVRTIGRAVPDRARPRPGRPGRAAGGGALAGHRSAR